EWRNLHESGDARRSGGQVKKQAQPELAAQVLGSAARTINRADLLRVKIYLTSPSDLFRRQRTRTFWIGSVIGASFLAALAGLFAAARSFSRQQQLTE